MTRILTVDDSRAIRTIVAKQVRELGLEVDEAEDGEQGLAKLKESTYDLVLLDVTMPVLDGPAMLERLRGSGNRTPVLMLTSESKRSVVATVMKLGIEDYILKPWQPDELRLKLVKILKLNPEGVRPAAAAPSPQAAVATPATPAADASAKQLTDVLVVDDMENVQKRLRANLPAHVSLTGATNAQAALNACRERQFRVVLVDTQIPEVNSSVLASQLRVLQGQAAFLALTLRTTNDAAKEATEQGFDGLLFKPFDKDGIDDFLHRYFDNQELITVEENLLVVNGFEGKDERLDKYFSRLGNLIVGAIDQVAAACFEHAIIDISKMPRQPDKTPRLILDMNNRTKRIGMQLRVVGPPDVGKLLTTFTDTAAVPFFPSVDLARAA